MEGEVHPAQLQVPEFKEVQICEHIDSSPWMLSRLEAEEGDVWKGKCIQRNCEYLNSGKCKFGARLLASD